MTPDNMEPMYPDDATGALENLALELMVKTAALQSVGNPITRKAIADCIQIATAFYTAQLCDIDAEPEQVKNALFSTQKSHATQSPKLIEIAVHHIFQEQLNAPVNESDNTETPFTATFLSGLHGSYYRYLSNNGVNININPGDYRSADVDFQKSKAPYFGSLPFFMSDFETVYDPHAKTNRSKLKRIVNIAAAHQRLSWILPFEETNPHVLHLFTHACFTQADLNACGLWDISRGFARNIAVYRDKITNASLPRINSTDGRGVLSNKHLIDFCQFFLHTAIDQVKFMLRITDTLKMQQRIENFVDLMVSRGSLRPEAKYILTDVFVKGKISKPDAMRITATSDKTLKLIVDELIAKQLLKATKEGIHMMYYPQYPINYAPLLFPGLFPADKEIALMETIQ